MAEKEVSKEAKLQGIMEYYIREYFSDVKPKIQEEVRKTNYFGLDPDMLDSQIEDYIETIVVEARQKFSVMASMILDQFVALKEQEVRKFELLFLDLVKRTLIKNRDLEELPKAIVIIADRKADEEAEGHTSA